VRHILDEDEDWAMKQARTTSPEVDDDPGFERLS